MSKTAFLYSSILCAAIAIMSGCQSSRIWPVKLSKEIQSERQFSLESAGGSITAIGTELSRCQVYAFTHFVPRDVHAHVLKYGKQDIQDIQDAFKLESDGDEITIDVVKPSERISIRQVEYVIILPEEMHVNLHTGSGDLRLINFSGDVIARTEKGKAVVCGLKGKAVITDSLGILQGR